MAHSITLTSTSNSVVTFQMKFGLRRHETVFIPANGTYTRDSDQVSGYTPAGQGDEARLIKGITWDEFINHPEMQRAIRGQIAGVTAVITPDPELSLESVQAAYESGYLAQEGVFYVTMTAGAGGGADDFVVMADVPFPMIVTDAELYVTDTVASTATLRDTAGGAGTALSSALDATAAVKVESDLAAMPALAEGDTIYARRADDGIGGIWKVSYIRTAI